MLKLLLKNITQPIILNSVRKIIPASATESKNCFGSYSSYKDASRACHAHSYEDNRIIEAVYGKTLTYKPLLEHQRPVVATLPIDRILAVLGLVFGLAPSKKELKVIDFGGACSTHCFIAKALLEVTVRSCAGTQ